MDYTKKISETSKQCNFIQNKSMNEQIRQLLIEQLQKNKNQQNKMDLSNIYFLISLHLD